MESLRKEGVAAELLRFPDRTSATGQEIDAYLRKEKELSDKGVHELFSRNRWEKAAEMRALLAGGTTLVVDRYAHSGVAFSAAKGVPGMDAEWCRAPDAGLPAPDVLFLLEISPEAAAARGGFGEERYETSDFQRAVAEQFLRLKDASWRVVDAARPVEAVHAEISALAAAQVERCRAGGVPLRDLW